VASGPELEVGDADVQVGAVYATVDLEDLAREVAAGRRGEKQDSSRDVLGIADPAERSTHTGERSAYDEVSSVLA
jgi:hypothetical protein